MRTNGTAILRCRNHPTLRWTCTKFTLPGHERAFLGAGHLAFKGEEGGKPSCVYNLSERQLAATSEEYQANFRAFWTPECDCPESDLEFVAWIDETTSTKPSAATGVLEVITVRD